MEKPTLIRTKINEKYIDKTGILRIKVIDGVHIDLQSLQEDAAMNPDLTQNKKTLALYDARAFFTIEPAARAYLKSGVVDETRIATAVLINNLAVRILVNGFIKLDRPKTPMKLFTNEQAALKWLNSFEAIKNEK
jgi:hypothetical protein